MSSLEFSQYQYLNISNIIGEGALKANLEMQSRYATVLEDHTDGVPNKRY